MKKMTVILLMLFLLLVGCNSAEDSSSEPSQSKDNETTIDVQDNETNKDPEDNEEADSEKEKGFVFGVNGIDIAINDKVEPLLERLGEPMDYFEAESCAFQGMERIYTYSGFEIQTYEIDGVDHVYAIILHDDSVSTKEGVYLYSTLDDVVAAYGEDYTKKLGVYTYEWDVTSLSFMIQDDEVVEIEYMLIVD